MSKDISAEGLRGLAAFNVFLAHFFLTFYPLGFTHLFPWVAGEGATGGLAEGILSLPILSVLWSGSFPVSIFFVLSGYVLTKKYRKTGDSSIIWAQAARRYFRLGIPVFATVMLVFGLGKLGLYAIGDTARVTHSVWAAGRAFPDVNFADALRDATYGSVLLGSSLFNTVLWTMKVEFFGSMLIFAYSLFALRHAWWPIAAAGYVALTVWLSPDFWPYYVGFLLGAHVDSLPRARLRATRWMLILAGIYLATYDGSTMFYPLKFVPLPDRSRAELFSVIAGAMVFYAIRSGSLVYALESRVAQFLGRISFSFYLVHVPVIAVVGCYIFNSLIAHGSVRSVAVSAALTATIPVSLFLATIFNTIVDQSAIGFGRWITQPLSRHREPICKVQVSRRLS
ncbi:acyltransferase [Luteibacter sp.]|jgi:peptidoglycan/LPS O-acetylase OafA/YrhL|uniref:acyltransferase family protein n=1 Tax=Luteibacter sp. TaxID=1886636 RepID=UPI002F426D4E